jgi:hypothetical protein
MAQECTLIIETELPIPFTVADGTGIEKGAILKLTDPMTAVLADGDGDYVAGIAAEEKIANNGVTKLAVYRRGIFKGTAGATAVTAGKALMTYNGTGDDNDIVDATNAGVASKTLGIALETAANNETFLFELNPGCNTNVLA